MRQKTKRMVPRTAIVLSTLLYFILIPFLVPAGDGYFTMVSLAPVTTVALLFGFRRGIESAVIFTVVNFTAVWIVEGSIASMTNPGGIMGSTALLFLGGGVGYLNDLARGRLQQVVEEKDRLIGTISHELRTPLTTVVGLSHELAESIDRFTDQEVSEFCRLIAQQSTELEALLEDLLVAARADIKRIKVRQVPVDLMAAVESTVAQTAATWDRPMNLEINCREGSTIAVADELRVRQIIRNLLQNAYRYGGSNVVVSIGSENESRVVTVSDDGPGIPKEQTGSIFEPHARAHRVNGHTDSLGLGLYVSRTLAGLMGGALEYRRQNGCTHFDLVLPCSAADPVAADRS